MARELDSAYYHRVPSPEKRGPKYFERVVTVHYHNPRWTAKEIASELHVDIRYVHYVAQKCGLVIPMRGNNARKDDFGDRPPATFF